MVLVILASSCRIASSKRSGGLAWFPAVVICTASLSEAIQPFMMWVFSSAVLILPIGDK